MRVVIYGDRNKSVFVQNAAEMSIFASLKPVLAALSAMTPQSDSGWYQPERIRWGNPNIFFAQRVPKEFFISGGFYYGDYRGRKSEIEEITFGASFAERWSVWYSHQDILLKGRAQTSRYRNDSEIFGARWLLQEAGVKPYGLAVEYETVRSTSAKVTTGNAGAVYPAPDVHRFKVIATTRKGVDGQLAFTRVVGVNDEEANLVDLAVGKDLTLSTRWNVRLQGHLVGQNLRNTVEEKTLEIKPVGYAALAYRFGKGAHIESDVTFMPSGTPLAYGRLTGLTSFQIYQPGGVAAGIRSNAFAVGAVRLVWRSRF